MPEISRFERVTDKVFQRLQGFREDPAQPEIPLGFERVRRSVAVKRFQAMRPEAKQKLIDKVGLAEVMKMIGEK